MAAVFLVDAQGQVSTQAGLLLYVPNSIGDSVSVFETNADGTLTSVTTITGFGNTSTFAAVRGDQAFAYVTDNEDDLVVVIDTRTNTVVQTVPTGDGPRGVAVSPDGTLVYVANNGNSALNGNRVSVFSADAITGQLSFLMNITTGAGTQPRHLAVSPDGSLLYIVNQGADSVHVVDTATNTIIDTIAVGDQPLNIAVNPAGTRVYVTQVTPSAVSVIDTSINSVVATPSTGALPFGVVASPDGTYFYVTSNNDMDIRQYNATDGTQIGGPVASAFNPRSPAISPDGQYMYVPQQGTDDHVRVFSATAGTGVLVNNNTPAGAGNDPENVGLCGNGNGMLVGGATFVANTAEAIGCAGDDPTFTGGTLLVNDDGLLFSLSFTLGTGDGTIDTNGNDATISGAITGTGELTKSGTGTLTLSGANTYTGGTTVSGGTLQGTTTSLQGSIINNAAVTFDQSTDGTYAGVISGTGGLTKTGTGTVTLSEANTYTGATTVSDGTLLVDGSLDSDVTVQSGSTLGGIGTINGDVTLEADATLGSNSTLDFTGTVTNNGTIEIDCDGVISGTITGNAPVDICPPEADDQAVTTDEDVAITLTGSNPDADPVFAAAALTFIIVTQPSDGTLSGTAPNLTYTPDEDFNGADSFTFIANDGTNNSTAATVSITVNAVAEEEDEDDERRGGGGRRVVVVNPQGDGPSVEIFPESHFAEHPLDRIQVSNSAFIDAAGVSISRTNVGQQISVSGTFTNHQEVEQDYAFIVQITNEDGSVVHVSWQQGTVESGATADISASWTPMEGGIHNIQIFVWDGIGASPTPLSTVTVDNIDVVE